MEMRFLPDEPIAEQTEDILGFEEFVRLLQTSIYKTETPFVYGVLGDWGTGKTSILKLLQNMLKDDFANNRNAYIPIWFNAWQYENEANIIYPLLHAIKKDYQDRLKVREEDKSGDFWNTFKQVSSTSAMVLADVGLRVATNQLTGEALTLADLESQRKQIEARLGAFTDILDKWSDSVAQLHNSFEGLLTQYAEDLAKKKTPTLAADAVNFVILIDDLDRCLPETTIAILESIKNYLTVKRCIFVFGLNAKVIYQGIRIKYSGLDIDGREYLEKILNYSFYVPEPEAEKVAEFVSQGFEKLVDEATQQTYQAKFEVFGKTLQDCNFNNPRKIKRILNRYLFFLSTYENKLDQYHHGNVVRFIVLAEYFPALFQLFLSDEDTNVVLIDELQKIGTNNFDIHAFEGLFNVSLVPMYSQLRRMIGLFTIEVYSEKKTVEQAQDVFQITRLI